MFIYRFLMNLVDGGGGKYITSFHHVRIESWMSTWLIPFFCAAIAGICAYQYSREKGLDFERKALLAILRATAYIMILFVLAMPRLVIEGEGAPPGTVPIVVDGTESMKIKDVEKGGTRIAAAEEVCRIFGEGNRHREDIREEFYFAGREFKQVSSAGKIEPDAEYTSINQMLERGIERHMGEYCPGLLLISDGAHNTNEIPDDAVKLFQKLNIPVYICGVGKEKSKDVSVDYILGEEVVFLNEKAKVYVNISQNGYAGEDAELKLSIGDKQVYSGRQKLDRDGEISIPVEYVPRSKGSFQLKAEITAMTGEITSENNVYMKNIRVIDEKIKILLLFGTPSWEYRYLLGAFERDKRVEVKSYLANVDQRIFKKGSEKINLISALPSKKDMGKAYDIVFLSKMDVATMPVEFVQSLRDFVEKDGGSLAVISDMEQIPYSIKGTALEELMPVTITEKAGRSYKDELFNVLKDELHFEITEDGNAHQLVAFSGNREENSKIWAGLPPVYNCYMSGRLKPSSISLMAVLQGNNRQKYPAIIYHSYGKGTVLFMGFDSTWRWRK